MEVKDFNDVSLDEIVPSMTGLGLNLIWHSSAVDDSLSLISDDGMLSLST